MKARILIVDDEFHQRRILREAATAFGHEVADTGDPDEALRLARFERFDLIVTDMKMPRMTGLQLLQQIRIHDPTVSVIVATAHGTIESAVEAMRKGAEDYLLKPIDLNAFEIAVDRVLSRRALVRENQGLISEVAALKHELHVRFHLNSVIGRSPAAQALLQAIKGAIGSRAPLMIRGESGTGKADTARMVHYNSPWASRSLLFFDCASVPESLREIQLFGEEMRVGTGHVALEHPGLIERAHLGTLVLSHPEALGASAQSRLLRVLAEERSQRVGGVRFFPASIRLVTLVTPESFARAVDGGRLADPLLARLREEELEIPPLRERPEDIAVQAAACLRDLRRQVGGEGVELAPEALARLTRLPLPGNVRELRDLLKAALLRAPNGKLGVAAVFPEEPAGAVGKGGRPAA